MDKSTSKVKKLSRGRQPKYGKLRLQQVTASLKPADVVWVDRQAVRLAKETGVPVARADVIRKAVEEYRERSEASSAVPEAG